MDSLSVKKHLILYHLGQVHNLETTTGEKLEGDNMLDDLLKVYTMYTF